MGYCKWILYQNYQFLNIFRFSNHPGSELEGECVDDPDQHHHHDMHNNINKTAQSVYLTQAEVGSYM